MASPYYVDSNAGPTDDGTSWANAFLTFAQGIAAAVLDGDEVWVASDHVEDLASDTTYTPTKHIRIYSLNSGTDALETMAVGGGYIGHGTSGVSVTFAAAKKIYIYGLTIRMQKSGSEVIWINSTVAGHYECEDCRFLCDNTAGGATQFKCGAASSLESYTKLINPYISFALAASTVYVTGRLEIFGGEVANSGTAPTLFIKPDTATRSTQVHIEGCDLSALGSATLVGDCIGAASIHWFVNCKLGSSYVALATQTNVGKAGGAVHILDCSDGDNNEIYEYHDGLGSAKQNASIYFTGGVGWSWEITTTAQVSAVAPFVLPWVDLYNDTLSSQTPYFEVLRDGTATKYKDNEVWAVFMAKDITGYPQSSRSSDGDKAPGGGTDQADGTDGWTGDTGAAFMKCDSGGTVTPAENGHLRGRIAIGVPSKTDIYVDPQIRIA